MWGCNRLYLLWFSSYSTFKFLSRDYHVIMTSQNGLKYTTTCPIQVSTRPVNMKALSLKMQELQTLQLFTRDAAIYSAEQHLSVGHYNTPGRCISGFRHNAQLFAGDLAKNFLSSLPLPSFPSRKLHVPITRGTFQILKNIPIADRDELPIAQLQTGAWNYTPQIC